MTAKRIVPIVLAASLVLAACGAAGVNAPTRSITVNGDGVVHVAPDIVTVNLGVLTQNRDVVQAVSDNNKAAQAILQAVRQAGIAETDVRTTFFNVSIQQPPPTPEGTPSGESIYWANNNLEVTVRQLDKLGGLLQAAVDAGANQIQGVTYAVADPSAAQAQARAKAMADARARAELLAKAAGVTLGAPININTNTFLPGAYAAYSAGMGGGMPVASGMLDVQAQVTVTFSLR